MDRQKHETSLLDGFNCWHKAKGSQGKGKRGKLAEHFDSKSHKAALHDFVMFTNKKDHVDILLDETRRKNILHAEKQLREHKEVIIILLDVVKTISTLGLAFRNVEESNSNFRKIVHLVSNHNPTLKNWLNSTKQRPYHVTYLSPDAQDEFISLLGEEIENKIKNEVQEASIIGLIADTTPDVSNVDQLTVAVRYVDQNGDVQERLLRTIDVHDKTGEGMANRIIECLELSGIDASTIRFQTYDSAASMSGIFNGAQAVVSRKLDRDVPYIPCLPHGINLVIEHGCKASSLVKSMFDALENLYVFFSSSTIRHELLKERLEELDRVLLLKNLSKTRWSARPEAIEAVWNAYDSILDVLKILFSSNKFNSETKTKANGLYKAILSLDFLMTIMFMKNIMYKTKYLSDFLQKKDVDVSAALIIMQATKKSIEVI